MYQLLAIIIFVGIFETNGQFKWDDATINDKHCIYPAGIEFTQIISTVLNGLSQGFKFYSPMANKTYYRWMYHKAKNIAATTQAEIDSLKPRIIFPDIKGFLSGLLTLSLAQGKVQIFNPPTSSYKLLCYPNNFAWSNATCHVKDASFGSAPYGFGTGDPVSTTIIWNDRTAFAEWHCFEGDRQVFNVISVNRFLTKKQIDEISHIVKRLGFNENNIEYQTY